MPNADIFASADALAAACTALPGGDADAARAVAARQATLTKPPGSLGRLETLVAWLACWQGRAMPRLDAVRVLVFAGNHGVVAQGVSPYPAEVTTQMVANYAAGGAAINALAAVAGASLAVVPLDLEEPTADLAEAPALSEAKFLAAVRTGYEAVPETLDLLCLGEMGIGNTTAAAALAAALFDPAHPEDWAGRGTGLEDDGLVRKRAVVAAAVRRQCAHDAAPLALAAGLGGRELAAMLGATLAARHRGIPVLLDGFVCGAAVAPLARLHADGLAHCVAAHRSAEAGHTRLLAVLGLDPLLDLGLRLGEGSGAALAVPLLRAALACHRDMASFAEAGVTDRQ